MNCERAQRSILLDQAGELASRDAGKLKDHLAACRACRDYRADLLRVFEAASLGLPSGDPSAAALGAIRSAAQAGSAAPGRGNVLALPVARLLAYAAMFLILLGGSYLYVALSSGGSEGRSRVAAMSALVAVMNEEETWEDDLGSTEADLNALARQLLRLEGVQAWELAADDESTPFEDPATDLQSRSTGGSRRAESV